MWMQQSGKQISDGEQYLELPRAIATKEGIPQKGKKSVTQNFMKLNMKLLLGNYIWVGSHSL